MSNTPSPLRDSQAPPPIQATQPQMSPKRKFHEFHCIGDVKLESNDRVLFRVNADDLKRSGTFFDDILSLLQPARANKARTGTCIKDVETTEAGPSTLLHTGVCVDDDATGSPDGDDDDSQTISIDATSTVLAIFIDLCKVFNLFIPKISVERCLELYKACDKYLVQDRIRNLATDRLFLLAVDLPWVRLIIAAQQQDLSQARIGLKAMEAVYFTRDHRPYPIDHPVLNSIRPRTVWQRLELLPASYRVSICDKIFKHNLTQTPKAVPAGASFITSTWPTSWDEWTPL